MNWKLCITDPQGRALGACCGSMDEGDGWGYGSTVGAGYGDGYGNTHGGGWGDGNGYADGYDDGESPPEWE